MAILVSNLDRGKILFANGKYAEALALFQKIDANIFDFLEASGLRSNSKKIESLNYLGIMFENGLGCEPDLEKAKKYYSRAFNSGILSAGISLAKLEYNTGYPEKAMALYNAISDNEIDPLSKAAAKYNLALIKEKNLYAEAKLLYDDAIAIYQKYYPNSVYHAEALYQKGQLELERARKIESQLLERVNTKESKRDLKIVEAFEQEAQVIFQQASDMGYIAGTIAVLSIESKALFRANKKEEALEKCNQALALDPLNINNKIMKASILEQIAQEKSLNVLDAVDEYDQALDLSREIMLVSPEHRGKAYTLNKELENKLSRVIALTICQNLKQALTKHSQEMEFAIDELGPQIASFLTQDNSCSKGASFRDVERISHNISQEILIENQYILEKISENTDLKLSATEGKQGKEKNLPDVNSGFRNSLHRNVKNIIQNSTDQRALVSSEDQKYISKREAFQEAIQTRMRKFYDTCQEVQEDDSNIETILQDDSSYETWSAFVKQKVQYVSPYIPEIAQNILVTMAPMAGLAVGSVILAASSFVKPLVPTSTNAILDKLGMKDEHDKKELLKASAKLFCDKVNKNQKREEYFRVISEELTKKYGMQLDNISQNDMRKLAHVAVKKMFNQVHNQTKREQNYPDLTRFYSKKREENTVEFFIDAVANKNNRDKFTEVMEVTPIFGGRWKVDDAFEKPAISINGKEFYANSSTDINKYGCMYQESKPTGYKLCKDLPLSTQRKLEEEFTHNARRISAMKRPSNSKDQAAINEELYEHRKNTYKEEQRKGKSTTKIGIALNVLAIAAGVIIAVGLLGPFAAIPAAALCIAGLYTLRNGLQKDINASNNLKNLEQPEPLIDREFGQQKQVVLQRQVEGEFTKKFASKPKREISSLKDKKTLRAADRESNYTLSK